MKTSQELLALCVAIILLYRGAGGLAAQTGDTGIPTYTETDLTEKAALVEASIPLKTTHDGLLVLVDNLKEGMRAKLLDSNGTTVRSFPVDMPGSVTELCVDPLGNFAFFALKEKRDSKGDLVGFKRTFAMYTPQGKMIRTVNLGDVSYNASDPWFPTDVAVDVKGTIYLATGKGIEVFDSKGKPGRALASFWTLGVAVDRDGMLYAVENRIVPFSAVIVGGSGPSPVFLEKIDPATRKEIWTVELEQGDLPLAMRLDRKAHKLFLFGWRFVTVYSLDGKMLGRVFNVSDSAVAGMSALNASFTVDQSGNIFFIARTPGAKESDPWTEKLYRYSPGSIAVQKHILTISHRSSYDPYPDLVIRAFQKVNPDWQVQFERTIERPEALGDSFEEILYSMATALMAGKGPDILMLADLPYADFADKGLLVYLDQMASADKTFDIKVLRQNVLDAFRYKDTLYVLPAGYMEKVFFASRKVMEEAKVSLQGAEWTWTDFFAAADGVRKDTNGDGAIDRFAFPSSVAAGLLRGFILPTVLDTFFDREKKQARFTDPRFAELLEATRSFAARNAEGNPFGLDKWGEGVRRGSIVFQLGFLREPLDLQGYGQDFGGDAEVFPMPAFPGAGSLATASFVVGINRNSGSTQKAWEFLKTMVSEEVQQHPDLYPIPLNNNAYAKRVQSAKEGTASGTLRAGGEGGTFTYSPLTDKEIAIVDDFLSSIRRSEYADKRLADIVKAELGSYFSGARSVEDACASLQEKAMTYLRE